MGKNMDTLKRGYIGTYRHINAMFGFLHYMVLGPRTRGVSV